MKGIITITKKAMDTEALFSGMDVYLIDHILRGRYSPQWGQRVLDAGAGGGRNLPWFVAHGFEVYTADKDPDALSHLRVRFPELPAERYFSGDLGQLSFPDNWFDHILCSAVLHFAQDTSHFSRMYARLVGVLKPGGTLFIRTAVTTGMKEYGIPADPGVYDLPDGTVRFLANRHLLEALNAEIGMEWIDPFKTVLVDGMRSMAVIMLQKAGLSAAAGVNGSA